MLARVQSADSGPEVPGRQRRLRAKIAAAKIRGYITGGWTVIVRD
jgi:hypothetical protein